MRQLVTCFLTVFKAPEHDDELQVELETAGVVVQQTGGGVPVKQ